jgi:hypothetical protein
MKRFILIAMMTLAAAGAWAQDLADFQEGFQTFAVDMASTLSYNATVGNNWSDAYLGSFPHFGVGLALGVTAVPADSLEGLSSPWVRPCPRSLKKWGYPYPRPPFPLKSAALSCPST